jgi:glycosyltransferase involved in cell wall biosynthesis
MLEGMKNMERLADADITVLPTLTENYGNVILESLSQGTPVLISDQVGLKDYVTENQFGWVMECDAEQWRRLLGEIWLDKKKRDLIRVQAPKIIRQHFNSETLASQYKEVYEAVHQMQSSD